MPGYAWDVFVSYRRSGGCARWVQTCVQEALELELGNYIANPRIFVDVRSAENGQAPDELLAKVVRSKLLLVVWTPPYNDSVWCLAEWATMRARPGWADGVYPLVHTAPSSSAGDLICVEGSSCVVLPHANLSSDPPKGLGDKRRLLAAASKRLTPVARDLAARISRVPPFNPASPIVRPPAPPLSPYPLPV